MTKETRCAVFHNQTILMVCYEVYFINLHIFAHSGMEIFSCYKSLHWKWLGNTRLYGPQKDFTALGLCSQSQCQGRFKLIRFLGLYHNIKLVYEIKYVLPDLQYWKKSYALRLSVWVIPKAAMVCTVMHITCGII